MPSKMIRKIAREIALKWRNPSRYFLERKIFPRIQSKKVLYVGVAEYTQSYPKILEKNNNSVWTIDIDLKVAKYGSKNHAIGSIVDAKNYYENNFFDVIFLIGIFGYGLDKKKEAEIAIKNIYNILKQGGIFIIQWTDLKGKNPINPRELKNIKLFKSIRFCNYSSRCKINSAIYEFFKK